MYLQKIDPATNKRKIGKALLADLDTEVTDKFLLRAGNDFAGFSALSLTTSDILLGEDVSSSNAKGKFTVQDIIDLVPTPSSGSQLDTPYRTVYVSSTFTTTGQFYNTLAGAITYGNTLAYDILIVVFPGTYTGNYSVDSNVNIFFLDETYVTASSNSTPTFTLNGGNIHGYLTTSNTSLTSGYEITIADGGTFECKDAGADSYASGGVGTFYVSGTGGADVKIKAHKHLGLIRFSGTFGYVNIEAPEIGGIIAYANASTTNFGFVKANVLKTVVNISSGYLDLDIGEYIKVTGIIATISGGKLRMSGRADKYSNAGNTVTGDGFLAKITAGTLILHDFQGKNASGGVVWVNTGLGKLITQSTVLEAGSMGGGADAAIYGMIGASVIYSGHTSTNSATGGAITESVTANHTVNAAVTIG